MLFSFCFIHMQIHFHKYKVCWTFWIFLLPMWTFSFLFFYYSLICNILFEYIYSLTSSFLSYFLFRLFSKDLIRGKLNLAHKRDINCKSIINNIIITIVIKKVFFFFFLSGSYFILLSALLSQGSLLLSFIYFFFFSFHYLVVSKVMQII